MDGLATVGWAGVNALLLWTIWRLCRRRFPHDTVAQTGIHTLVLFWAAVTLACFLLGGLHLISGWGVVGAGVVLAAFALGVLRYAATPGTNRVATGGQPAGDAYPEKSANSPTPPAAVLSHSLGWWLAVLGWLALFSLCAARILLEGLRVFPTDFDSLMYHVPLIDHWLQAGSLYAPDCPLWYNASTNELLGLWIVAPFSGDFLVVLNNVPACLLFVLGALELVRNLGLPAPFDYLIAFAVAATQVYYRQLIDNENDIAVAGLFFVGIVYGLRYMRRQATADMVLVAVSLGLLAGIKYYAVGYAVVAWTGLSLCAWNQNGRRAALRLALAGALGALVFSGYWYVRNICLTGTPFFPLGFTGGTNTLPDFYPNSWHSTFLGSGRPEVFPLALTAIWNMAGPCHLLALLAVPITLGWLIGTGLLLHADAARRPMGVGRWLLAFLIAGAAAVLLVTPWAIETEPDTLNQLRWSYLPVRFGQCFLGLTVLALGILLADLTQGLHGLAGRNRTVQGSGSNKFRRLGKLFSISVPALPPLLLAGLLVWQTTRVVQQPFSPYAPTRYPSFDVLLLALNALMAALFLYVLNWTFTPLFRRRAALVLLPAASATLAWGGTALAWNWHTDFARHYDTLFSTRIFTTLTRCDPSIARICALYYRYYPFFGSRRQYRLCRPMKAFSYPWLTAYLQEQQVNVVACLLYDPLDTDRRYRDVGLWVRDHPDVFVCEEEDSRFVWANINRDQLAKVGQP